MINYIIVDIRHLKLFLCLLVMRLLYLFIVRSYFVPDEYWQSLEIAHKTVFGYGYVTWEWDKAIRSFFYPFWVSLCYKILEVLKLDYVEVLVLFPRILQSVLSAVADMYLWCWLNNPQLKIRKDQVNWIFAMWLMCLFVNYCSSRTLTNTAELNFSVIAMYYFPLGGKQINHAPHFLWFVGLACLVRPTAVIQWLPLCVYDIFTNPKPFKYCLTVYLSIISKILCLSIIVDLLFYKRIVLTPLNFILYNGQYNVGLHYGVHSWFWYFINGIPVVLGPVFILFYFTVFRIVIETFRHIVYKKHTDCDKTYYRRKKYIELLLFFTILWTIFWYSIIPHKEFRFILPLVPAMIYLAGTNVHFNYPKKSNHYTKSYVSILICICAVACNVIGLIYLGRWHQIGQITAMSKLARIAKENPVNSSFLFLTPCHAVPFYSHIHVNISAKFLTCEPNLLSEEFYKDESDLFFETPLLWLNEYMSGRDNCSLPSHVILFSNLRSVIENFLESYNYKQLDVIFNSHFIQGKQSQYLEIFHVIKPHSCYN